MPEPTLLTASLYSAPRMRWADGTFLWCTSGTANLELNRSEKPNTLKCTAAAFLVGNGSLTVINVAAVLTRSIVGFALSASQTWLGIPMLVGR